MCLPFLGAPVCVCVAVCGCVCGCGSHHIASASHDGTVNFWDVRSSKPLFALGSHDDKALCVAFVGGTHIVSGGADCKTRVFTR